MVTKQKLKEMSQKGNVHCPYCDGNSNEAYKQKVVRNRRTGVKHKYILWECLDCEGIFQTSLKEEGDTITTMKSRLEILEWDKSKKQISFYAELERINLHTKLKNVRGE